jgi:hypothetical protein
MSQARAPGGPRASLPTGERRIALWLAVLAACVLFLGAYAPFPGL